MTPHCEVFIRSILAQNWLGAYMSLNLLEMREMLRALAAIDRLDLAEFWAARPVVMAIDSAPFIGNFVNINMPRIEFAYEVVTNLRLPASIPADIQGTNQVGDARTFIANRRQLSAALTFENDLTNLLPAVNANPPTLTEADYEAAARNLGCEVAAIQAVATVESGGRAGFAADGRPIIRYELHIFQRRTNAIYHQTHPHLSQPDLASGNPYHTRAQANEWSLMHNAMILRDAARVRRSSDAWQSASWGMFQLMGFNYGVHWNSIDDMVTAMYRSENEHLNGFVGFCRQNNLVRHIIARDWASFARVYNGRDYAVNNYDTNMANAYTRIRADRVRRGLTP